MWTNSIQSADGPPWGFDDWFTCNNASLSRVLDPLNEDFGELVLSGQPVCVAQEWYFPERVDAGSDPEPWFSLWDWHSTNTGGGNRWHTAPGLMLAEDGSMRVEWQWGTGPNAYTGWSSSALPVDEWFDIEMKYQWSSSNSVTLQLWVNGFTHS